MNRKSKSQPAPQRRRRLLPLFVILFILGTIFLLRGGVTGMAVSMADSAIIKRKTATAERWLNLARYSLGNQGPAEYLRARVARLQGDHADMIKHLVKAHELGYDAKLLDREQEIARLSMGEMDSQLESRARNWIAELPGDVGLIVDAFANGLAAQSRFNEAATLLEDYEKAFPNDPMVNYRFGILSEHVRDEINAEKEYRTALSKDPNYVQAAWRLARLESGKNAPLEALEILKRYDYGPQSLAIKTFMAHCYEQSGDLEKGRELFKTVADLGPAATLSAYRVVDEMPERFLAASALGTLDVKLGNWEEAKHYLELALKEDPRDFVARNSYGQVLRRLGYHEEAAKVLAQINQERSEYDKITVLREQINQDASNTAARLQMGKIVFKYESERFGLFWIRSALAYEPHNKEAHEFLSDYYNKKSQEAKDPNEKRMYDQRASFHRAEADAAPEPQKPTTEKPATDAKTPGTSAAGTSAADPTGTQATGTKTPD